MADGDIWRLTPVWSNGDTGEELTSHIDVIEQGIVTPTVEVLGAAFVTAWGTAGTASNALKSHHYSTIALERVELRRIVPLADVVTVYDADLPIAGTGTGTSEAPQVAILTSLRTGKVGRSFRGRVYWPPPATNQLSGPGHITEAAADDISDRLAEFLTALEDDFVTSAVTSFQHNGAELDPPVGTPITSVKTDQRLRTQRKRAAELTDYGASSPVSP